MTLFIGTVGATIILILFILNQLNKIEIGNFFYDFGNLIGGLLLVYYSILISSIPFLVINAVWALFSAKDVLSSVLKK